jgi:sterol desaturase/sphingolipid hydroxylase (fatty acid hydroxylase superfamily)
MPAQQTSTNGAAHVVVVPPEGDEEQVRKLAVEQIERKRRFYTRAFGATALAVVLVIIWALAEYHNAHGWPTNGFSQSSGIYHTWNSWIVYPLIALALGVAIDCWHTFRHRPITEDEIRREMDRLRGTH